MDLADMNNRDTQRIWDLIRHQRSPLHEAQLITDDEYASLAEDHAAVPRLENYDRMMERIVQLRLALQEAIRSCEEHNREYHHRTSVEDLARWKKLISIR